MKIDRLILLIILTSTVASTLTLPVHAAQTVQASGDARTPPLYTLRDKQVTLAGSGYAAGQPYYIWTMGPKDNRTTYSGTSFTAISTGVIPPGGGLPLSANSTLGTYLVSISNSSSVDTAQARAHFGIWGTSKPLYVRTESLTVLGGGLYPGVNARLSIRNSVGDYVKTATVATNVKGTFNYTWRIPEDSVTDAYRIFVDGTGTFDNSQQDYLSELAFTVTVATLTVKISQQPDPTYQRTETAKCALAVTYPDGSPVVKSKPSLRPVTFQQNQTTVATVPLTLADPSNGVWTAEAKLLANATLSSKYRFTLAGMSFDDGFGNKGAPTDMFSSYFKVSNASLLVSSQVNGTQIQVPFGEVSIISKIAYHDGTPLRNGTVRAYVSGRGIEIDLTYDQTIGAWRGSYSSTFGDLWHIGKWTLEVEAADLFGNLGSGDFVVTAQPYLFVILITIVVAVALFGGWVYSRYSRKVYFKLRKALQKSRPLSTERFRQ
jgi:hypothetical protein